MDNRLGSDRETLFINKSDARCGNCGKNAMMREETHDTVYAPGEGCGVRWRYVDSDYSRLGIGKFAAEIRPDLLWIGEKDDYVYWYENPEWRESRLKLDTG